MADIMSAEIQMKKERFGFGKIILLITLIGLILFFVFPSNERAFVSSNLARIQANILIRKIPLPDGMEKLASWDNIVVYSNECYLGEAFVLAGTDLDSDTVGRFYKTFFASWGWNMKNLQTNYPSFIAGNIDTEGVSIFSGDKMYLSYWDVPTAVVQAVQEEYKYYYEFFIWYFPIESRSLGCTHTE
jgi:hypothetical protein